MLRRPVVVLLGEWCCVSGGEEGEEVLRRELRRGVQHCISPRRSYMRIHTMQGQLLHTKPTQNVRTTHLRGSAPPLRRRRIGGAAVARGALMSTQADVCVLVGHIWV